MSFTAQDLLLAQEVQSAALPLFTASLPGINIAVRTSAADCLGGDFHMVLQPQQDHQRTHQIGLVVGDVSGKGLPASLIATSIGHLFPLLRPLRNPSLALSTLNQDLFERTPSESYATLVFAETDLRTDVLRLWSAGHPPAILWHASTGEIKIAMTGNPPVGCFSEWLGEPQEWKWASGDVLILYSDGLVEARDSLGRMFDIEGLISILRQRGRSSVQDIAEVIMETVHSWGAVTDDVTVLVCQRSEAPPFSAAEGNPVRVLLVDDHCIWRDGMRSLLQNTEFEVVGEAGSGRAALETLERTKPDLVLLDIRMADGDGLDALRAIREQAPNTKVVMLTTYDHPHYKARALAGGAAGYLLKGMPRDEMLADLRAALTSNTPPDTRTLTSALRAAANVHQSIDADDLTIPLTSREAEVIVLLSSGMSNADIAKRLFISEGTVKSHVEHIIRKLGVADRVQVAVWAARHGLASEITLDGTL